MKLTPGQITITLAGMFGWINIFKMLAAKTLSDTAVMFEDYSEAPNTERSVWQTELKSVRLLNVRILNVRFVRFIFSAKIDRFIYKPIFYDPLYI